MDRPTLTQVIPSRVPELSYEFYDGQYGYRLIVRHLPTGLIVFTYHPAHAPYGQKPEKQLGPRRYRLVADQGDAIFQQSTDWALPTERMDQTRLSELIHTFERYLRTLLAPTPAAHSSPPAAAVSAPRPLSDAGYWRAQVRQVELRHRGQGVFITLRPEDQHQLRDDQQIEFHLRRRYTHPAAARLDAQRLFPNARISG
jgi:hypothetical protein